MTTLRDKRNAIVELQQLLKQFELNRANITQQISVINQAKEESDAEIANLRKQLFTGLREQLFPKQETFEQGLEKVKPIPDVPPPPYLRFADDIFDTEGSVPETPAVADPNKKPSKKQRQKANKRRRFVEMAQQEDPPLQQGTDPVFDPEDEIKNISKQLKSLTAQLPEPDPLIAAKLPEPDPLIAEKAQAQAKARAVEAQRQVQGFARLAAKETEKREKRQKKSKAIAAEANFVMAQKEAAKAVEKANKAVADATKATKSSKASAAATALTASAAAKKAVEKVASIVAKSPASSDPEEEKSDDPPATISALSKSPRTAPTAHLTSITRDADGGSRAIWGNAEVRIFRGEITVFPKGKTAAEGVTVEKTPGLQQLLMSQSPSIATIKSTKIERKRFMRLYRDFAKGTGGGKKPGKVKKILESLGIDSSIDLKNDTITAKKKMKGSGVAKSKNEKKKSYFASPSDMIKRLKILLGSKNAGNSSVAISNEVSDIADALLIQKIIKKQEHKAILSSV